MEWPSQSPDLNPIEMLWHDLKKVVCARKPSDVAELKQFCKEEWDKIPSQPFEGFIESYRKHLFAVVAAKCGPTRGQLLRTIWVSSFFPLNKVSA